MGYSVYDYAWMAADEARAPYIEALRRLVTPDTVVVELGTGYGAFALVAAALGARKVYAIEPNPAIRLGQELLSANPDLRDRVVFFERRSEDVELPERGHLLLSDIRGSLPLLAGHIQTIRDARNRLVVDAPIVVAQQDTLFCGLMTCEEAYEQLTTPWVRSALCSPGLEVCWDAVAPYLRNQLHDAPASGRLLSTSAPWARLDYATVEHPDVSGVVDLDVLRDGTVHGICVWFDTTLCEGISFSNAPGQPDNVYGRALLPLATPLRLAVGDRVRVDLSARTVNDNYCWQWQLGLTKADGAIVRTAPQSTFRAELLSLAMLRQVAPDAVPRLTRSGQARLAALTAMEQQLPLRDIASRLVADFPDEFPDVDAAMTTVGALAMQFGA